MLKSSRIPPLLNRVCNNGISSAYLITSDGALLGASSTFAHPIDPSDLGALVAEVVEDYKRLGTELSLIKKKDDHNLSSSASSSMEEKKEKICVLIQLEKGLLGISSATDSTYVVALGESVQHGWLKMQLQALAGHVRDSGMY
jgi:hypothetical protein